MVATKSAGGSAKTARNRKYQAILDKGLSSVTLDVHLPEAEARPDDLSRILLILVPQPWDQVPFPIY